MPITDADVFDRRMTVNCKGTFLCMHRGIFYTNRGIADWRFPGPDGAVLVRARVGLRVNNGDMMRDAAVAGLGVALLPMFIVGAALRAGELRVIDVGAQPEPEFIFIAHTEGRRP